MQSLCSSFKADSRELYSRVILNVLLGNTDDHARNHAFFVNGDKLEITPAYDICPQNRAGGKASHGMNITVESNLSSIDNCLRAAPIFQVSESEAIDIIKNHVRIINHNFESLCDEANLSYAGRQILWRRAFLNDYIFYEQESFKKLVTYELT
jgi:serine/threonine-protein kinase HipA